MKVDFFKPSCCTENITSELFGICDDEDSGRKTPAYVDYDNRDKWIAEVKNKSGKGITFIAVDNCIEIYRENGDIENRCDAMLLNSDNIVFIELKVKRRQWIQAAIKQLKVTIGYFKDNNDINKYKRKRAFACNKKHSRFNVSTNESRNKFYNETGVLLHLECEIDF